MEYPPGWTCDVVVLKLEVYILDTLPRADALAVAEHLEACHECVEQVWHVRVTVAGRDRAAEGAVRRV